MNRSQFNTFLYSFYRKNKRSFPWRNTRNPYHILVSEIMLQQTGVSRVEEKYTPFIKKFPTVVSLSKASLQDILRLWQGLGYNRRALLLKKAAEKIVLLHKGIIPKTKEVLLSLPGVGESTASGVLSFAFNIPHPFIETNIRRVFIKHFFPNKKKVSDKIILSVIEKTIDTKNPRKWYSALMDYGSYLGKTEDNHNKRSAVYVKQSKFKGSDREIRGALIRHFTKEKKAFSGKFPKERVKENIKKLVQEGFLIKKGNMYAITN